MIKNDGQAVWSGGWPLGLMVVHSPARDILTHDLAMAQAIGAGLVELLPRWSELPDASEVSHQIRDSGLKLWSIHGPWGGQSIKAARVDLSDPEPARRSESVDDVRRAIDFAVNAGAELLVVHPGGLSEECEFAQRSESLMNSLGMLVQHVADGPLRLGVENMPKGVHPGSRMQDLCDVIRAIDSKKLGLVLDTGHANITADVVSETAAAGQFLISTHVHDNNGKSDTHLPPGQGNVDWPGWFQSLRTMAYRGPVILECVKYLREKVAEPEAALSDFLKLLL